MRYTLGRNLNDASIQAEECTMQVKKYFATTAIFAGLGATALGFGAGQAGAGPHGWGPPPPPPPPPGHVGHIVGVPPGHIAHWVGVPPGHWDKPWKWLK